MKFTKMHGCGNTYIYINCFEETVTDPEELSRFVSDIRFGIGSDGLILISPSETADFKMNIFNADGSEAKMCGNGIRCVAKYVYDKKMTDKTEITVETNSGIKTLKLKVKDGKVEKVTVDMGAPVMRPEDIPVVFNGSQMIDEVIKAGDEDYRATCVSMGNPHCVTFVDDVKKVDIEKIGPVFENHEIFPDRVNTEFIHVIDRNTIDMRVWERGSGETWACGTGACASVVACVLNGLTDEKVLVHLAGGDLDIEYNREKNTVYMTGPAAFICEGQVFID